MGGRGSSSATAARKAPAATRIARVEAHEELDRMGLGLRGSIPRPDISVRANIALSDIANGTDPGRLAKKTKEQIRQMAEYDYFKAAHRAIRDWHDELERLPESENAKIRAWNKTVLAEWDAAKRRHATVVSWLGN